MEEKVRKSEAQWRAELSEEVYDVCRGKGTERAFTGAYWDEKRPGLYRCACCALPLFGHAAKFDSGSGWPSFTEPVVEAHLRRAVDESLMMRRVEVLCARCDAHLGHVFDDGPAPGGLRYCINSVALELELRDS